MFAGSDIITIGVGTVIVSVTRYRLSGYRTYLNMFI